jgi:cell division protein FtsI (penicillin-binding protein 3)
VVGVFLDEPKGDVYGGSVAAPAFRAIVADAMKTLGVPAAGPAAPVAPAVAQAPAATEDDLEGPPPVELGARTAPRPPGEGVAVPSLAGLPARAAVRTLERLDLAAELDGSGRVVGQWPAAGRVVEPGTRVRMRLAPAG